MYAQKRSEGPQMLLDPGGLYTILTKDDTFSENDKTKARGLRLLGVVNYGEMNMWGRELMVEKVCLARFVLQIKLCLLHGCVSKSHPPLPVLLPLQKEMYALLLDRNREDRELKTKIFFKRHMYLHGEQGC